MRLMFLALGLASAPGLCHAQQVFVGYKGQLNAVALGCPSRQDASDFSSAQASAEVAKDTVGAREAVNTAIAAGCQPFAVGATGLVIDSGGWVPNFDRIRMDKDQAAY